MTARPRATVLVSAVGSTAAQGVVKALRAQEAFEVRIVGTDAAAHNAGRALVDEFHLTPRGDAPDFPACVEALATRLNVDVLVPVMGPELEALAPWSGWKHRWLTAVSGPEVILRCHDKPQANETVARLPAAVPPLVPPPLTPPYIVKPRRGTGSRDLQVVRAATDATPRVPEDAFVQRFIEGRELSVDVYRAFRSDDVFAVPRVRLAVKGGLAVHTLTVEHPTVVSLACRITAALGVRGPANLQFIEDARGELWFLECNPRFGGATIASITAGLDGPGYLLREHFRQPLAFGGYRANLRMLRYWNEVYES